MPVSMSVLSATKRDLRELHKHAPDLANSALAAAALQMAREIDSKDNSATSKSMCARSLSEVLEQLRDLAPEPEETDRLDDLTSRRDARRAGRSAS